MRKIKVVVLLVQQLQHGFPKNAKVSPNLTVASEQDNCNMHAGLLLRRAVTILLATGKYTYQG